MAEAVSVPFGCEDSCQGVSQIITTPGVAGSNGAAGSPGAAGANAFSTLTSGFNMPAVSATVVSSVADNTFAVIGQNVFVENAGYMKVVNKAGSTSLTLENIGATGNASPGTPIANGSKVSPGGVPGTNGSNGANGTNGINSFCQTTANFVMPAVLGTVAGVLVDAGDWIGIGQTLFVENAGVMECTAKASNTSITLKNLGTTGNAAPTTVIPSGSLVSPSGPITDASGPAGGDLKGTYPNPLLAIPNAKGALAVGDGTDAQEFPVGADGDILVANSSETLGVEWTNGVSFAFPSGVIVPYVGETAPLGWLTCQGDVISRVTYANLFAAITMTGRTGDTVNGSPTLDNMGGFGTTNLKAGMPIEGTGIPNGTTILAIVDSDTLTMSANATATNNGIAVRVLPYGQGNGTTTFTLPDFRGRSPLGWQTGTGLTQRFLGDQIGSEDIDTGDLPLLEPNSVIAATDAGSNPPYMLHASQWAGTGISTTTTNGDATATMANTASISVGQIVYGTGIVAGTRVASITDATTFELSQAATASGTNTLDYLTTASLDGSDAVNPRGGTTGSPPAQNDDSKMSPFLVANFIIKI